MADEVDDEVQSEPEAAEVEEDEDGGAGDEAGDDGAGGDDDGKGDAPAEPEPDVPINVRPIEMIRAHLRIGSAFKIFDHDDNNQVDARYGPGRALV